MPLYEHVFLTRQDASAQQVEELTAQFKGVIEQMGGKIAKLEQWGVKTLSYRMRKNRKAHFTLLNVEAPPAALAELIRLGPQRLVYVSCEPSTQARDVALLIRAGYRVRRAAIVDMFPQTYHIESVVLLERAG